MGSFFLLNKKKANGRRKPIETRRNPLQVGFFAHSCPSFDKQDNFRHFTNSNGCLRASKRLRLRRFDKDQRRAPSIIEKAQVTQMRIPPNETFSHVSVNSSLFLLTFSRKCKKISEQIQLEQSQNLNN